MDLSFGKHRLRSSSQREWSQHRHSFPDLHCIFWPQFFNLCLDPLQYRTVTMHGNMKVP